MANCIKYWGLLALLLLGVAEMKGQLVTDSKSNERKSSAATKAISPEEREKFTYFFLEAQIQKQKENFDAAFELLQHCLEIDPEASEVYYHLSMFYLTLREFDKGEAYLKRAIELEPNNYWYMQLLATRYEIETEPDKAIELYEQMTTQFPERTENLQYLVTLYIRAQRYVEAIDVLNRLEEKEGKSEMISMEKVRLYSTLEMPKMAFKEINQLAKEYPYDIRYRLILANLYLEDKQEKKAHKLLKQALQDEPKNPEVIFTLATYYKTVGNDSLYLQQLDSLLYNPKGETEHKMGIMADFMREVARGERDTLEVIQRFDKLTKLPQNDSKLLRLYANYLIMNGAPNDSITPLLAQILELDPEDNEMRSMLVRVAFSKEDYKKMIELCNEGLNYAPEIVSYYYLKGHAHYKLEEREEALKTYQTGVTMCSPTERDENFPGLAAANLYSAMGDILYEMKRKEEAYAMYDSCLSYEYDNVLCLNNYAYYLSLDKQNLDKAEEMSYRTIKTEPNNRTYLDTYAWILFIKGRYEEAKTYIDKVMEVDSTSEAPLPEEVSAIVVEHAGDIYYKVGEVEKALEYWKQAFEMKGGTTDLLPQKIEQKKYVE